jgi:dienelactone hydrolase
MRSGVWKTCSLAALCSAAVSSCGGTVEVGDSAGVARTQRVWIDTSRSTPHTNGFPGAPERTLRVLIWHPGGSDPLPLLVLAHGFGGLPEKFDAFAHSVAAAGFVVAAPAFPLTNENAPGGHEAGLRDLLNQPGDLSFVITQMLRAASAAGGSPAARTRSGAVAVLGHSLGGVTTIGLTRKDCCRDARVAASVLVAATAFLAGAFGGDPITTGPPTLIIHGTSDESVGYSSALDLYDRIQPPRFLLGLIGAEHSAALESQTEPPIPARAAAQAATIAFLNAAFRGGSAAWQHTLARLATEGNIVQQEGDLE